MIGYECNKTYYLLTDLQGDDELFTNKAKAIKEAKKQGKTDIMIFRGREDDELANYIGQVEL